MLPVLPASRRFFVWLLEDDGVKDGQSSSRFDGVSFDKKKKSKCFLSDSTSFPTSLLPSLVSIPSQLSSCRFLSPNVQELWDP